MRSKSKNLGDPLDRSTKSTGTAHFVQHKHIIFYGLDISSHEGSCEPDQIKKNKKRERERGRANFFRHGHVLPSFRVPVRRGRRGRLRDRALGLIVPRLAPTIVAHQLFVAAIARSTVHRFRCRPEEERRFHREDVGSNPRPNASLMSSQSRRPSFPVGDGVGRWWGMVDGGHRRRMISSSQ